MARGSRPRKVTHTTYKANSSALEAVQQQVESVVNSGRVRGVSDFMASSTVFKINSAI